MASKLEWGDAMKRLEIRERAREYWRTYRFLEDIQAMIGLNNQSAVLDVGCGIATVLHFVPGKEKIGVDPLGCWYAEVYEYPAPIRVLSGQGEQLGFPEARFDAVFCSNALDHVSDHLRTLSEIKRVTKANGYFVLTVEIHPAEHDYARDPHHPHTFSKKAVRTMLETTGWEILFERETPFLGIKQYSLGGETKHDVELVIVAQQEGCISHTSSD
ncbi:class I SAM-dependent methyltransferase [Candidatus Wolfebacteria bacterium]|nr:class I SAM-dependent methyltransferase [Candidatus Wolfebacteria bacterium]